MCKESGKNFNKKIGENVPCWYSMSTTLNFDSTENKHNLYCGDNHLKENMLKR